MTGLENGKTNEREGSLDKDVPRKENLTYKNEPQSPSL